MHELAYGEWLLAVVLEEARDRQITSITVRMGSLHAIVPDILRFAFHLVSEGTPADGATLDIVEVSTSLLCHTCGKGSAFQPPVFECGRCGSSKIDIVTGEEFSVDSIVLDGGTRVRDAADPQTSFLAHVRRRLEREHQVRKA